MKTVNENTKNLGYKKKRRRIQFSNRTNKKSSKKKLTILHRVGYLKIYDEIET